MRLPLYPQDRTLPTGPVMSVSCHYRKSPAVPKRGLGGSSNVLISVETLTT
jgi:hypothetical protein